MSLDDLIEKENRKNFHPTTNPHELKEKIEKFKQRSERFANEEDRETRENKIHRMEKKLEWTVHKASPLPI